MVAPLRHRQTKEAETDMFDLQPPRHISTLHEAPLAIGQSNVRSARILQTSTCFAPISFPLFQGVRFGGGRIEFSSSMVILLELSEDGMVRRMPDPLNYGSFREWCRHRLGLGTDKGRCL
jgi:hypothetical protein